MISKLLPDIEEHFKKEYPREGCGLLCVVKGKMRWVPCENVASDNDDFIIDSKAYLKHSLSSDIVGIVHSHPDSSSSPSEADIVGCNSLGIPYYIFSYPDMDLTIVQPQKLSSEGLYGREYSFGKTDCFEAARDYLAAQDIHIPKRIPFEDDWWNSGLDYFTEDVMRHWGFKKIDLTKILPNDIITFKVTSPVANHCGVYLGNEVFYHHAINRLSCRESLFPMWNNFIHEVYRYAP